MTDMTMASASSTPGPQDLLRRKIGWLCHAIRIIAVLWICWLLFRVIRVWSEATELLNNYARYLQADLSGLSNVQYDASFAVALCVCAFAVAVSYFIWRLFGTYLQGRIFTIDAAVWMRRLGVAGIVAVMADVVARPLIAFILTTHLPAGSHDYGVAVVPGDLLHLLFSVFVLALAHIFKTAAEIADDHSRIV